MGNIYGGTFRVNRIGSGGDVGGFRIYSSSDAEFTSEVFVVGEVNQSDEIRELAGKLDFKNIKFTGEMI